MRRELTNYNLNLIKLNRKPYFIFLGMFFFISCATPKKIYIIPNKKTGDLEMVIDPIEKEFKLGIVIGADLTINVGIPELIVAMEVTDENNNLLWKVEAIHQAFGGHRIIYGKLNEKEYIQTFPNQGIPQQLKEGEKYNVKVKTVENKYLNSFIYQHSTHYWRTEE